MPARGLRGLFAQHTVSGAEADGLPEHHHDQLLKRALAVTVLLVAVVALLIVVGVL